MSAFPFKVAHRPAAKPQVNVQELCDDITHALHRSWFFDPKTIDVTVQDGRVRLAGAVQTPEERQIAAATAWRAPNVVDVENKLVVRSRA